MRPQRLLDFEPASRPPGTSGSSGRVGGRAGGTGPLASKSANVYGLCNCPGSQAGGAMDLQIGRQNVEATRRGSV